MIEIEVAYAPPGPSSQALYRLSVPEATVLGEALRLCGVLEAFPALRDTDLQLGIHSRPAALDTVLNDGDRVEIYRPLTVDPKDARRLRAQKRARK